MLRYYGNFIQVEEQKAEPKRLSISKKGLPQPEEPVDELSKVKLGKAPQKPEETKLEEPQIAKTKKSVKKVNLNILLLINITRP